MYVFLIGYYPILKDIYDRRLHPVLRFLAKFVTFNVTTILAYLVIIYILLIPIEGMGRFGKYTAWILLAIGNVAFFLYDWMLGKLVLLYRKNMQKHIRKIFRFEPRRNP